jgi:hypothetical protein
MTATSRSLDPTHLPPRVDELPPGFLDPPARSGHLGRFLHYEVIAFLGRGETGPAFKGFDEAMDPPVVVRVLAAPRAADPATRQGFLRDARAGGGVIHENVVAVHAVGEHGGLPFLVMQDVEGVALQERLERNGPPLQRDVLRLGAQTARGLAAAHEKGLVHGNLTPGDILLERPGERVKLSGFHAARAGDGDDGKAADPRADLSGLGGVLYALCTGLGEGRRGPVREECPGVADWLADIVDGLNRPEPDRCFRSAAGVAALLERHLAHLEQPDLVPMPRRRGGNGRWVVPVWLVATLGLVLLVSPCVVAGLLLRILIHDRLAQAPLDPATGMPLPIVGGSPAPGMASWAPEQATGAPDTWPRAGDIVTAWASQTPDGQDEWLLLEYDEAVAAVKVLVYETFNPGALSKVTVFREDGTEVEAWSGADPTRPGSVKGISEVPVAVDFKTKRVKIYLSSTKVAGWNEIDAVGIKDADGKILWAARAWASSSFAGPVASPPP